MKDVRTAITGGVVLIVLALVILFLMSIVRLEVSMDVIKEFTAGHRALSAVLLGLLMCIATVVAPLAVLPMVPVVAPILGPFTTGLASYLGWCSGSIIAFWIGRKYGQPFVERIIETESLLKLKKYVRQDMSFLTVVLLRAIIPADALSYVFGIFTRVSLRTYVPATFIGLLWFPFAFAYLGDVVFTSDYVLYAVFGVVSVAIVYSFWKFIMSIT